MSFEYEVMTEQEAMSERFQLLKEGVYEGVITSSEDKNSSKGNPMMDMTVTVFDKNGKSFEIRDFLVFSKVCMWKVVHFVESADCAKEYQDGKFCSEIAINKRVLVKVGVEPGALIPEDKLNGKPLGSKYFDKNKIEDYLKKDQLNSVDNELNDDVPF